MQFNLFVGIKTPGAFQHSSFTSGGLISSAGLIKVKNGRIKSLSPLSGHYRTSIEHFKYFLRRLEDRGADLSSVQIGKAEAMLWGLGQIAKMKKAEKHFVQNLKDCVKVKRSSSRSGSPANEAKNQEESGGSDQAQWKRHVLHGRPKVTFEGQEESKGGEK